MHFFPTFGPRGRLALLLVLVVIFAFGCEKNFPVQKNSNKLTIPPAPSPHPDQAALGHGFITECNLGFELYVIDVLDVDIFDGKTIIAIRYFFFPDSTHRMTTAIDRITGKSRGVWVNFDGDSKIDAYYPTSDEAARRFGGDACNIFRVMKQLEEGKTHEGTTLP